MNQTTAVQKQKHGKLAPAHEQLIQLQQLANNSNVIHKLEEKQKLSNRSIAPIQQKTNNTGLPDRLKSRIENLSGYSMDDVKIHYNSAKPAQLQAHAYAQGTEIHIASGQEKHLSHEAWHVVQQKQGRVKPTRQLKEKTNPNDDVSPKKEADIDHPPIQRALKVGETTYSKAEGHQSWRPLLNEIYEIIKERGFAITNRAIRQIHEWLDGADLKPNGTAFGNPGEVVAALFARELLYRELRGPQLGPRTLGTRPAFTGPATRLPASTGR